jgi:dienelactone hydrolase
MANLFEEMSTFRFAAAYAVMVWALLPLDSWAAQTASKQIPAKIELHPVPTLTLSDQQFLTGDSNTPNATVSGELRIAQGQGRLPVVVLVHGSGGMIANVDAWANAFNAMGVSTFAVDSFTGRGIDRMVDDQSQLGRLNMIIDVYRALGILAKHPRVDSNRIALMGFSRGGQTTLYSSLKRFQRMWNQTGVEFAAYISFYGDCTRTYISDTDTADRPIRMFHGTGDDYVRVAPCRSYLQRLRQAGRDAQLTEYPNAPHVFDNPLGTVPPTLLPNAQIWNDCLVQEGPIGVMINVATKMPFTLEDECVRRGAHVGYDRSAYAAAHNAVESFLRGLFGLT